MKNIVRFIFLSYLLSGCMLLGYDEKGEPQLSDASSIKDGEAQWDARVIDAGGNIDAKPSMDAATPKGGATDASGDAGRIPDGSAQDAARDDSGAECTPSATWCEANAFVTCDAYGNIALRQDCAELAKPYKGCKIASCNPSSGCALTHAEEGIKCNDGLYCTTGETCAGGYCQGGVATDCSFLSNSCRTGFCDTGVDSCAWEPKVDTVCGDNAVCDNQGMCAGGGSCGSTDCAISCDSGAVRCSLNCSLTQTCTAACGASNQCGVDCQPAGGSCQTACQTGSTCEVYCAGSTSCGIECADGAKCVLRCQQTGSCNLTCGSGSVYECPLGGVIVCNSADCPTS